MKIAIIGAGNVGSALATSFSRAGHDVVIASREPADAGTVAAASGARVATSNIDAAASADLVVLATPFTSAGEIAAEIGDAVAGKPVVDVSNRMAFGDDGPQIDTTSSNAEELAALLPRAHVIKAFNTLFAANQTDPIADGIRLDGFVAGDDPVAKSDRAGARRLDRPRSGRRRPAQSGPSARGDGLPEHRPERDPWRQLAVRLEARRGAGQRSGGGVTIVIDSTSAAAQTGV